MKVYKVLDGDNLGTLSWTATTPATKNEIARALTSYHNQYKDSLSTSRSAYLPTWGAPTLSDLLKVYNLTLVEA